MYLASCAPERRDGGHEVHRGDTNHDVVEGVPRQLALSYHSRGDQGADGRAQAICTVKKPKQLVCVLHIANPGVPGAVFEAVAETGEKQDDREDGVRRVRDERYVTDHATDGTKYCNASLTELVVYEVVG